MSSESEISNAISETKKIEVIGDADIDKENNNQNKETKCLEHDVNETIQDSDEEDDFRGGENNQNPNSKIEIPNTISERKEWNQVAENEEVHIVKINERENMIDSGDEGNCEEVENNTEQKISVNKIEIPNGISETKWRNHALEI